LLYALQKFSRIPHGLLREVVNSDNWGFPKGIFVGLTLEDDQKLFGAPGHSAMCSQYLSEPI